MESAVHIVVRGLVQGVGFRWYVCSRAREAGLSGYTRNLVDGSVEVVAEGERALLERLVEQVRRGPRAAQVADLALDWTAPTRSFTTFEIR